MYNSETPSPTELPSTARLLVSTLLALIAAAIILVVAVLPAEYGYDPTGIGTKLGLTDIHRAASGNTTESMEITSVVTDDWRDEVSVTIEPYGQLELKLSMQKGQSATFEWLTDGGKLDIDLHGDGASDKFISYKLGENKKQDNGTFTADFNGTHGWYWVNKSKREVTVTLRTNGEYSELKRVL